MENKAGSRNLNDGNVVKAEHLGDANKIEKMNDVSDKRNTNGVSKRRRRKKIDDDLSDLTQENIDEYYRQAQEFKVDVKGFVRRLKLGVYCLHGMQSITTKFDYSEIDREKLYERCTSPLSNSSEYRFCNDNYQRRSFDSLNDNYSFIDQLEKDTKIANEEKSDSLSTLESSDQSSDTSSDDASIPLYNDGCIISSNFYRDSGSESSTSACKDVQTDDQKQQEEHEREKQIRNKQILDVIERLQARHRNY
ncbi:hypothetical protein GJ496_000043 [Pomphorhynchus laevis]|nr:hypothetical protein GJ496_000043 [Pomphorhynchus laevis]